MKTKSIQEKISATVSTKHDTSLLRLSVKFLMILLLSCSAFTSKAESYYIINPYATSFPTSGSGTPSQLNEWMKMKPVDGSSSQYYIILPAVYPVQRQQSLDNEKEGQKYFNDSHVISYLNTEMRRGGYRFAVASKTVLEKVAVKKFKDNAPISDFVGEFLYPDMSSFQEPQIEGLKGLNGVNYYNGNYWVYEDAVSGTLSNTPHEWEIRMPIDKDYVKSVSNGDVSEANLKISDMVETDIRYEKHQYSSYDPVQYKAYHTLTLKEDQRLNGSYKFTIDMSTNTWTMEYLPDTKVSYMAVIPKTNQNPDLNQWAAWFYQNLATYCLTQTRNADGSYPNIYDNPSVYLKGDGYLVFFGNDNYNEQNSAILRGVRKLYPEKSVEELWQYCMEDTIDHNTYSGPSALGVSLDDNYLDNLGYVHKLSKNIGLGDTPLSEDGYYYHIRKYPYLYVYPKGEYSDNSSVGFIKIGDGEGNERSEFQFNKVWIMPGLGDGGKINTNTAVDPKYELEYDWDRELYSVTLTSHEFLIKGSSNDGLFYFQGSDASGNLLSNYIWSRYDDSKITDSPTSFTNSAYITQGSEAPYKKGDLTYYINPEGNDYNGDYKICFKVVGQDTGDPKFCYWVELEPNETKLDIKNVLHQYIRSYSASCSYNLPEGVKAYVVTQFRPDSTSSSAIKVATAYLKKISYIPANTGVILYAGNGTTGDIKTVTLTKYTGEEQLPSVNYLKPCVEAKTVATSDESSQIRLARNFFFSKRSSCIDNKTGDTDYLGFFRAITTLCGPNKAYLSVPVSYQDYYVQNSSTLGIDWDSASGAKGIALVFDDEEDDTVSGVTEITTTENKTDDAYYTLTGVKVANPQHGIYIHGGKKIYIK